MEQAFPDFNNKISLHSHGFAGYGQSGKPVDTISMDFYAEQVEAFIKAKI
ncbi:MAG: hypothetical protein R3B47_02670 [Bacteroidia bacterium]